MDGATGDLVVGPFQGQNAETCSRVVHKLVFAKCRCPWPPELIDFIDSDLGEKARVTPAAAARWRVYVYI